MSQLTNGDVMQHSTNAVRDRIAVGLTILFLLSFSLYSVRGLLLPEIVSARFGAPVSDATATLFFRVYLSRNIVLILLGLTFLKLDARKPLAILVSLIAGLPVFDASVLLTQFGSGAQLSFHVSAFVLLAVTSGLLWLRALAPVGFEDRKPAPGQAV
ncbi:MAG TPA: DUF4267 domain-containing protein [Polyangiales bacterium]|nr:DUF4267 domain-containing protein [Polyangiales bacterium]